MGDMADFALDEMMDMDEHFLLECERQGRASPVDVDGFPIKDPFYTEHEAPEDPYWIRIRPSPLKGRRPRPEVPDSEITGKYLFFSKDVAFLERIACREVDHHGFPAAKISRNPPQPGGDHVLCLYWKDDSRKGELAKRYLNKFKTLKYRYWKSDAATRAGSYSREFLESL